MVEIVVRKVSDGEELVLEQANPGRVEDPREWTIETRRLAALDDQWSAAGRPAGSTSAATIEAQRAPSPAPRLDEGRHDPDETLASIAGTLHERARQP